jgi:hypothetical protein
MVSSNGREMTAISEAPAIAWFPLEMLFIGNVVNAIKTSQQDISQGMNMVDADSVSL